MGHHNQLEKYGKPYCPASYQLSGPGSEYSATATVRGIPYEFPSVDRVVGREWTGQGEREAATRRFIEICREARYGGVPKSGGEADVLGFDHGDCLRNPHLRFSTIIFVQQLSECLVDMTVNRDDHLLLLINQWTGCPFILGFVLFRAATHPTSVAFGEKNDIVLPLSAACFQTLRLNDYKPLLFAAKNIHDDAVLMVRCGIKDCLISAVVSIWRSCIASPQLTPLQWSAAFVAAIELVSEHVNVVDTTDGKKNGLAAKAALN